MSGATWKTIIAIVLIAHGIGHSLGLFPVFGIATQERWTARSWLLTPLLGEGLSKAASALLWIVTLLGFILVGLAFEGWLVPPAWFQTLGVPMAVLSLAALALYWNAFPAFVNKAGAIAVNTLLLYYMMRPS